MAAGLLALSGCSGFAADGDSLLHPPRPTGDKAAIQDIISREAGGTYNLKYPQKGVNRSAIILRNENTDNEYALALYSTENDSKLNVSIISYSNEQWKCLGTYTNNSSGVDRVLFCDINADKREEIVIGWTSYNSAHKSLTAYSFDKDEVYEMSIDEIGEDTINENLWTSWMPDPDLLIRTGGEVRISNFLLWQCAYSEFYFCDAYWPDFSEEEFYKAIASYQNRQRRYGKTEAQIEAEEANN